MKQIIAVAAFLTSAQAFAFWDHDNGATTGAYNGAGDMVGNATGEAEATFSMDITGKTRQTRNFQGNADTGGNMNAWGYETPGYSYSYGAVPQMPAAKPAPPRN